ncbi:MAG: SUMF1/EgtB/PvdO family nonheme iron enzyme [Planctomycetaceae bacterium]|nr:SUMF1/EgtB/PvdO family nonheme iron enzyme [Planctomycetaceae bacterium]
MSLDELTQLDELAEQFEDALSGPVPLCLEEVIKRWRGRRHQDVLRHLLHVEIEFRRRRESIPVREDYRRRFPNFTPVVDSVFAELHLPPESHVGPYRLLRELGFGGMGVVYEAEHQSLKRLVALKLLRGDPETRCEREARFRREMQALGAVSHPNLVQATDAGEHNGIQYLVMELLQGADLHKLIQSGARLPLNTACEIIRQAALGLAHAHSRGLVHRDIKPANLMLTDDGNIRILDLGLAQLAAGETTSAESITQIGQVVGTIDYLSPEQARNAGAVDPRSDVFSLGATLFRLLTGASLLDTGQRRSTTEKLAALICGDFMGFDNCHVQFPADFKSFVLRMVHVDPDQRIQTAGEVADFLQPWCHGANLQNVEVIPGEPAAATQMNCDQSTAVAVREENDLVPRIMLRKQDSVASTRGRPTRFHWAAGLMVLVLASVVIRVMTNGGEIRIQCEDPSIEVEIIRDQNVVDKLSVGQLAGFTWFRSGEYEIRIPRNRKDRLIIEDGKFELLRGKKHLVTITVHQPTSEEVVAVPVELGVPVPAGGDVPFDSDEAKQLQVSWSEFLTLPVRHDNTIGMTFMLIPPGTFQMGCPPAFKDRVLATVPADDSLYALERTQRLSESPQHRVRLTRPFYLGVCEVTQAQYETVMGVNPAAFSKNGSEGHQPFVRDSDTSEFAVENVSWVDAIRFCNALSRREGRQPVYREESVAAVPDLSSDGYRLATEAEFEFASRAGTNSLFFFGNDISINQLNRFCWWSVSSSVQASGPTSSGRFPCNPFGLEGVHGNTYEWVQDWYSEQYYEESPLTDPRGPESGEDKVLRGGGWHAASWAAMASHARFALRPEGAQMWCGLRVAINIPWNPSNAVSRSDGTAHGESRELSPLPLDVNDTGQNSNDDPVALSEIDDQGASMEASQTPVAMLFRNDTDCTLRIIWVDFEGHEKTMDSLLPGRLMSIGTGHGHLWRFQSGLRHVASLRVPPIMNQMCIVSKDEAGFTAASRELEPMLVDGTQSFLIRSTLFPETYITLSDNRSEEGRQVRLQKESALQSQSFRFVPDSNGFYQIETLSKEPAKIRLSNSQPEDGTPLVADRGAEDHLSLSLFRIYPDGPDHVRFVSARAPNFNIGIDEASMRLILRDQSLAGNTKFQLISTRSESQ